MYVKDSSLIQAFWVVAETGSLSKAAVKMGCTQPTLTRQIQTLEKQSGLHLFQRSNKGLRLTEAGEQLVESSKLIIEGVEQFNRVAVGQDSKVKGEVRISANEVIGYYMLPKAITELRNRHPELQVELDINNNIANLSKRDADIAFRMSEPKQLDLVGRKLPDLPLGIYGTKDLINKYQRPMSLQELFDKPVIGFDKSTLLIDGLAQLGIIVKANQFAIRTDGLLSQINFARSGSGYCFAQSAIANQYPELELVLPEVKLPSLPFWLICHSDVQYSKKIQTVAKFLGEWFRDDVYHSLTT